MRKCPECGGKLERIITPNMGIIFKGSGFYETDYKIKANGNGNNHGENKAETHVNKKTEKKVEKKIEKKQEASKKE